MDTKFNLLFASFYTRILFRKYTKLQAHLPKFEMLILFPVYRKLQNKPVPNAKGKQVNT
ncbi:hypothetical protein PRUB_a3304 [Pseudoalteromonas rubra]|uniref:Uncharacterized protein n=1 Tax=Pseudoalteromonas rubra TaxID=43658 RepID=A0A8T0C4K5_9GAMM|nr:hypothetical protein PRUB_a3304 [Pseudoalteromonas rubra]